MFNKVYYIMHTEILALIFTFQEYSTMADLAKMFLHCLNHWNFESPSVKKNTVTNEDFSLYKIHFTR